MTQVLVNPQRATSPLITSERLEVAYDKARSYLFSEQSRGGFWVGELSSSPLSTATAVCALALVDRKRFAGLVAGGVGYLLDHQNSDGGWGDTVKSLSNLSTTMLCRAALVLGRQVLEGMERASHVRIDESLGRAESYLESKSGSLEPQALARAVRARYGKDHTFSVPILSCSSLAGLLDWSEVRALPFELACLPSSAYRWLNLPVVSYALPALIAIGILQYTKRKPLSPLTRLIRRAARPSALRKLEAIQPENGGFLEATPLTSFVVMSLAGAGLTSHPATSKGVDFLINSARADGSWPIDTNLSTWVTTLSINALFDAGEDLPNVETLRQWLLDQQYATVHPFTSSAPGGWGWTPLPGAVPDADDTSGALIALRRLGVTEHSRKAALSGLGWLLALQNRDGGWPTFCRGWGFLPFDRSSADITAHALRALYIGESEFKESLSQLRKAIEKGVRFLEQSQRPNGSWVPLWFGNQYGSDDENPTYGTARVLAAYRDLNLQDSLAARRGYQWLVESQSEEGGWGGAPGTPPSIEETALAIDALLGDSGVNKFAGSPEAIARGLEWLVERVEDDRFLEPSPIGFYFAKLWYFEKLYPVIFTVGALGRALRLMKVREQVRIQTNNSKGEIYE